MKIQKTIIRSAFFIFLFIPLFSFGQTQIYSFNSSDSLFTLSEVKHKFYSKAATLERGYCLKSEIFHKESLDDTIINFISITIKSGDSINEPSIFNPIYNQSKPFLLLNEKFPEFTLKDISGNTFSSSMLSGKPSLIHFWDYYSNADIPSLNEISKKYGDKMNLIAITSNMPDSHLEKDHFYSKPFDFYILISEPQIEELCNIKAYPVNFFLDKNGYVRNILGSYPMNTWGYAPKDRGYKSIDQSDNYWKTIIENLISKQ